MKKICLRGIAAVILSLLGCVCIQASTALCPFGQKSQQPWQAKYYNQYYGNSDPANWYAADFDESGWQTVSGPVSTANGLPYYATDWGDNYRSYYLRRHFNVSSLSSDEYVAYASHDDGCEMYLNGVRIYSSSDVVPDYRTVYVPNDLLHTGDNVLAMRVRDTGGGEAFADFGLYSIDAQQWIDVELSSPGTLGREVLYQVEMLSDVELIRVKGAMNSDDWNTLKNMANLVGADLSKATANEVPNEQFRDRSNFMYIRLPQGLKTIGEYAFYRTAIGIIYIPAIVTTIGRYAFSQNLYLTKVDIAAGSALSSIGDSAFDDCRSLSTISLPAGITEIKEYTFYNCQSLASVVLPPALESIGRYSFSSTYALKHIDFPQTLTGIGEYAFYHSGLESVVLPLNLTTLDYYAFGECRSMKTLELPSTPRIYNSNYNSHGYRSCFFDCTALETVTCHSATPPLIYDDDNPFYELDRSKVTLVVPAFSLVDYKLDDYWHGFGTIVGGAESPMLNIGGPLTLTNNRRPENKVDVLLGDDARLTVGGNAPFEIGTLTFTVNRLDNTFGQLQNSTPAMRADHINTRFYAYGHYWYFITPLTDVNVGEVVHDNAEASFVFRYYNGQNRAGNGPQGSWQDLTDNTLHAGQGYILQTDRDGWLTMPATITGKAPALESGDAATPLKTYAAANAADASWNFVGNPYPCYYDTYSMELAAPITVWDYDNWTYRAYSPIDDGYVLRPMEAFFVQKPASLGQILFPKEGRLFTAEVERPASARSAANTNRQLFDLTLTDGTRSDLTRVVANPQASAGYEPQRDASKFISTKSTLQLFTLDKEGNQLAINERPFNEGDAVALGFSAAAPGVYTISLGRAGGKLLLHDALTGQTIDLSQQDYHFTIDAPVATSQRFSLSIGGNEATEVNAVAAPSRHDATVYDLQGRPQPAANGTRRATIGVKQGKKYLMK